ncbi:helix-turn-helix transcriptional regulator [Rhizobium sp. BK176]|uniref:helix-turn-helix domain-containing protein n=1 Tax=Rhizobium sp. BK176 TaxID=2587071 RepID=UPI002167A9B6|nr:helix-turn-helix transcriptional regulator [Rhizobium sp. BK176]MCS4088912.1 transcriptional regulator with XRE-family HTH domain [Rhizobium sp. BK176]
MEERFRDILRESLDREGMSAAELSREVGMDKAYFVDLLAGRKKTVSAIAFMLAARRLGLDPWDLAGVDRPDGEIAPAPRKEASSPPEIVSVAVLSEPVPALRVEGCGVVEEAAFRVSGRSDGERSFAVIEGYPPERQFVFEVRGHDYVPWGLPSGAVVHTVSFPRYETVGAPGRLVVASRQQASLTETVLRRVTVDGDGEMKLMSPMGAREKPGDLGLRLEGLVVQSSLPAMLP